MPRYRFEVVDDLSGLIALLPAWRQLTQHVGTVRHFHLPEWFLSLVQALEQIGDHNYLFVTAYDGATLVAIVPLGMADIALAETTARALRLLSNIRETPAIRDMVCAHIAAAGELLADLVNFLASYDKSWSVLALAGVLQDSAATRARQSLAGLRALTIPRQGTTSSAEFICCGPADQPFRRLSKGFRQNLRTSRNRLAGRIVSFEGASEGDELLASYEMLKAIESSGWKSGSPATIRNNLGFDMFLRHLMSNLSLPSERCEIHTMKIDEVAISAMLCVVVRGICFIHVIGYDERWERVSPGHLLTERLIVTRGCREDIELITPYHVPAWFPAWKPAEAIPTSDIYIFRPGEAGDEAYSRASAALPGTRG